MEAIDKDFYEFRKNIRINYIKAKLITNNKEKYFDEYKKYIDNESKYFSDKKMYETIKSIKNLDEEDKLAQQKFLKIFEYFGVNLDEKTSNELNELKKKLKSIENDFLNEVDNASIVYNDKKITIDNISRIFLDCSDDEKKYIYNKFYSLCRNNASRLLEALKIRDQIAKKCNYDNFFRYKTNNNYISDQFKLEEIFSYTKEHFFPIYLEELEKCKKYNKDIEVYNINSIYQNLKKSIKHKFTVRQALDLTFEYFKQNFNYDIRQVDNDNYICDECLKYEVYNRDEICGILYLDLYERKNKSAFTYNYPISPSCVINGERILPSTIIISQFNDDIGCDMDDMINLWHEIGHAQHNFLCRTKYSVLSGSSSVENDLTEIPSTFMEFLCQEHLSELHSTEINIKNFNIGYITILTLARAMFDNYIHTNVLPDNFDFMSIYNKICSDLKLPQEPNNTCILNFFVHIMSGYEGQYYKYLIGDIYSYTLYKFRVDKILFKKNILEKGACTNIIQWINKQVNIFK